MEYIIHRRQAAFGALPLNAERLMLNTRCREAEPRHLMTQEDQIWIDATFWALWVLEPFTDSAG
jgi:hypothetical protein